MGSLFNLCSVPAITLLSSLLSSSTSSLLQYSTLPVFHPAFECLFRASTWYVQVCEHRSSVKLIVCRKEAIFQLLIFIYAKSGEWRLSALIFVVIYSTVWKICDQTFLWLRSHVSWDLRCYSSEDGLFGFLGCCTM